jgi:hypothetical protein
MSMQSIPTNSGHSNFEDLFGFNPEIGLNKVESLQVLAHHPTPLKSESLPFAE